MEMENRSSLKLIVAILIRLLILIAVVILLVWLFPTKQSLNPLYQDVFRNNINQMKEAAETYFTNERLPQNVGDKVRLTLKEMQEKHLIVPFVDRYGKECDLEKSYVEITKTETEYELKVNLVCSKEESYIIEHMGCNDKCAALNGQKTSIVKEYEYQKDVKNKVISSYKCDKGYTLKGNKCITETKVTDKINATPVYKEVETTEDPIEKTKTVDAKYSDWSDWGENKEYDPDNNNIKWGEQELVWNEKNGAKKITKKITKQDKSKPIYQITYDNYVGSYTQYLCSGYSYYRDSNNTTYQVTDWVKTQTRKKMNSVPDNTNTTKYVVVGMDFESCSSTCTLKPYYLVDVYTRNVSKVTKSANELKAVCNVTEQTIPVYGKKQTFIGYETEVTFEISYKYLYHTKTRTKISEGKEVKYLVCKDGSTPVDNKCKTTKQVISTYTCPTDYKRVGETCYKDTTKTVTKNATPVYKTVNSIEYKWSTKTSLNGYTKTGRTRNTKVSTNNGTCTCTCN